MILLDSIDFSEMTHLKHILIVFLEKKKKKKRFINQLISSKNAVCTVSGQSFCIHPSTSGLSTKALHYS